MSSTPTNQGSVSKGGAAASLQGGASKSNTPMSSQGGASKSNTPTSTYSGNSQSTSPLSPHSGATTGMSPMSSLGGSSASATPLSAAASDVAMESVDTPRQEEEGSDGLNKNLNWSSGKPESSKNISVQEGQQGQLGHGGQDSARTPVKADGQYCS